MKSEAKVRNGWGDADENADGKFRHVHVPTDGGNGNGNGGGLDKMEINPLLFDYQPEVHSMAKRKLMNSSIAQERFKRSVLEAAADLTHEFHGNYLSRLLMSDTGRSLLDSSFPSSSFETVKKGFFFHLNSTGHYVVIREHLRHAVTHIVQQCATVLRPTGFSNHREFQNFLHDMYIFLTDHMHECLNDTVANEGSLDGSPTLGTTAPPRPIATLDHLLYFAEEALSQGDTENCHRLHLQRICLKNEDPGTWLAFALMWCARGDDRMAEIAIREALKLDPKNINALLLAGIIAARHKDERAIGFIGQALLQRPLAPEILVLLATAHRLLGNDVISKYFFLKARLLHNLLTGADPSKTETDLVNFSAQCNLFPAHAPHGHGHHGKKLHGRSSGEQLTTAEFEEPRKASVSRSHRLPSNRSFKVKTKAVSQNSGNNFDQQAQGYTTRQFIGSAEPPPLDATDSVPLMIHEDTPLYTQRPSIVAKDIFPVPQSVVPKLSYDLPFDLRETTVHQTVLPQIGVGIGPTVQFSWDVTRVQRNVLVSASRGTQPNLSTESKNNQSRSQNQGRGLDTLASTSGGLEGTLPSDENQTATDEDYDRTGMLSHPQLYQSNWRNGKEQADVASEEAISENYGKFTSQITNPLTSKSGVAGGEGQTKNKTNRLSKAASISTTTPRMTGGNNNGVEASPRTSFSNSKSNTPSGSNRSQLLTNSNSITGSSNKDGSSSGGRGKRASAKGAGDHKGVSLLSGRSAKNSVKKSLKSERSGKEKKSWNEHSGVEEGRGSLTSTMLGAEDAANSRHSGGSDGGVDSNGDGRAGRKVWVERFGSEYIWAAQLLLQFHAHDFIDGILARELFYTDNRSVPFLYILAQSLLLRKREREAKSVIEELMSTPEFSEHPYLWELKGHIHNALLETEEAMESYEKCIRFSEPNQNMHLTYLRFGNLCSDTGNMIVAKSIFLKGVTQYPSLYMWLGLGNLCYRMGDFEEAETAFSHANRMDHTNPSIWGYLSMVSLAQGNKTLAEQCYKWAIRFGLKKGPILDDIKALQEQRGYGDPSFPRIPNCIPHEYFLKRLGRQTPLELYRNPNDHPGDGGHKKRGRSVELGVTRQSMEKQHHPWNMEEGDGEDTEEGAYDEEYGEDEVGEPFGGLPPFSTKSNDGNDGKGGKKKHPKSSHKLHRKSVVRPSPSTSTERKKGKSSTKMHNKSKHGKN